MVNHYPVEGNWVTAWRLDTLMNRRIEGTFLLGWKCTQKTENSCNTYSQIHVYSWLSKWVIKKVESENVHWSEPF